VDSGIKIFKLDLKVNCPANQCCLFISNENNGKNITFRCTAITEITLEIKMIRYWFNGLFVFILSVNPAFAESETRTDITRGVMLYDNHCIQCHTQQIHWREKKMATDWESLITQVDRWQRASGLEWSKINS
jgi:hypothetical protein